jgi:hypothetical protein
MKLLFQDQSGKESGTLQQGKQSDAHIEHNKQAP